MQLAANVTSGTHKRERVTRPGKLYCLFLQSFIRPLISDKFPQVSGTGSSDGHTEEKRASKRSFSCKSASAKVPVQKCQCKSASAEGKNGNTDFTSAAYRVTSQLPFCRSYGKQAYGQRTSG
jgi:hypothetical protein